MQPLPLLKDNLSRPPFSPPQNRSTNQGINKKTTPYSTLTISLIPSYNLLRLLTEDYLGDLLAKHTVVYLDIQIHTQYCLLTKPINLEENEKDSETTL